MVPLIPTAGVDQHHRIMQGGAGVRISDHLVASSQTSGRVVVVSSRAECQAGVLAEEEFSEEEVEEVRQVRQCQLAE